MAHHVAHQHADSPIGEAQHREKIAADVARRIVAVCKTQVSPPNSSGGMPAGSMADCTSRAIRRSSSSCLFFAAISRREASIRWMLSK